MASSAQPWYSVRCLLSGRDGFYEERITIWRAADFDRAVELAEDEARSYAQVVGGAYLGLAQAFLIGEDTLEVGTEVFSLIRKSELPPKQYLDRFFDTGAELQGTIDGS